MPCRGLRCSPAPCDERRVTPLHTRTHHKGSDFDEVVRRQVVRICSGSFLHKERHWGAHADRARDALGLPGREVVAAQVERLAVERLGKDGRAHCAGVQGCTHSDQGRTWKLEDLPTVDSDLQALPACTVGVAEWDLHVAT